MAPRKSWPGAGVDSIAWRRAKPVIIESNCGSDLSVQHAEWIENDPARHDCTDSLHINLAEFRPGRRNNQSVGPLATFDRTEAPFEFGERTRRQFRRRIKRLFVAVRNARDDGERRGVLD